MKKSFLKLVLPAILIMIVMGGCRLFGTGSMAVEVRMAESCALSAGVDYVVVTARNGGLVEESGEIPFSSGGTLCAFNEIPVGIWKLEVVGYDSSRRAIYSGNSTVSVIKDLSSSATVTLEPMNGEFEIDFKKAEYEGLKAEKIDIWVYPLGESRSVAHGEFTDLSESSLLVTAANVKPRTYEYQIRASKLDVEKAKLVEFYKSPWYVFSVLPGLKTIVNAELGKSEFSVNMDINAIPVKPTIDSFVVEIISNGSVQTSASIVVDNPDELSLVTVYTRFQETDRYSETTTYEPVPSQARWEYSLRVDDPNFGPEVNAWLVAVSTGKNGLNSIASDQASAHASVMK